MTATALNAGDIARQAKAALDTQQERAALPQVEAAAKALAHPRLWQWAGLLHRAIDEHEEAATCFAHAAHRMPQDAQIAHGRARVAFEAGIPAVDLFLAARRLAPNNGDLLLDLASAHVAEGDVAAAIALLREMLRQHPGWVPGHHQLAHLRWMTGDRDGFTASFGPAIATAPGDADLWQARIVLLIHAERYEEALRVIAEARVAAGNAPPFDANEAVVHSETGMHDAAGALFDTLAAFDDVTLAVRHVRHLLRIGAIEAAGERALPWVAQPGGAIVLPYLAIVARLSGNPRWERFAERLDLVGVYDLGDRLPPLDRLAEVLRGLHTIHDSQLDQSVRGGSQTNGPLFSRIEPEIRQLRGAVTDAVAAHVAAFPPRDPADATLSSRRDREPRFAGAWSVRLRGRGSHANHVHPEGWLSSALYVALPQEVGGGGEAGWLTLGSPQAELGLKLEPTRAVEPKPGRLVLFPSTMWHGTRPFEEGERLAVAFDVSRPAE